MSADWPRVPLCELLSPATERVTLSPTETYREVKVRWWGKGLAIRREMLGAETATSGRVALRPGQFIISRIDALHGASAIVPASFAGAVVTNDFPVFTLNETRLLPGFLDWYSKTTSFVELCRRASEGTTNRIRLKEVRFLQTELPLPPLAEQRRIVARVEAIAGRVAEARRLRDETLADQLALVTSLHLEFAAGRRVALSDLLKLDEDREEVRPDGVYPQVGVNGFGGGLFPKEDLPGTATTYRAFNRLYPGAVVLSQVKGWEGAIAVCPDYLAGRFASPEYRTFRCREGQAEPRYFAALLTTPWFWHQMAGLTRGVGARRERVRPELFLALDQSFPTIEKQQHAVQVFDRLAQIQPLQSETATELDALLPTLLSKAFDGEL